MLVPVLAADSIFRLVAHGPEIQRQETIYFTILCFGGFPGIACAALAGFFSGRGETWPVMWVNVLGTGVNILLDSLLIFGAGPLPEMGIAGAAWATNASVVASLVAYIVLMARPAYARFRLGRGWRFDPLLFRRILRFGLPSGIQFFIDMA